jgi:hypothetical protein
MNTPKPCDTCTHLYYDALAKDDPGYTAECKLLLDLGHCDCPFYCHYNDSVAVEGLKKYYVEHKKVLDI